MHDTTRVIGVSLVVQYETSYEKHRERGQQYRLAQELSDQLAAVSTDHLAYAYFLGALC